MPVRIFRKAALFPSQFPARQDLRPRIRPAGSRPYGPQNNQSHKARRPPAGTNLRTTSPTKPAGIKTTEPAPSILVVILERMRYLCFIIDKYND